MGEHPSRSPLTQPHGIPLSLGAVGLGTGVGGLSGPGTAPALGLVATTVLGLPLGWRTAATGQVARG